MSEARVAARYATSLFDLAQEKNKLEEVTADARQFLEFCKASHPFELMLKSPIVHGSKKKEVITRLAAGHFQPETLAFIGIVVKKNREIVLKLIFQQYLELYQEFKGIISATVYTAMPVSEQINEQIKSFLKKTTQKQVELETSVKPELVGGFVLKYEDKLIDASVATQLKSLRHHLIQNN